MAMKKIGLAKRRLSRYASKAKKAVLENFGKTCCLNRQGPVQGNRVGIGLPEKEGSNGPAGSPSISQRETRTLRWYTIETVTEGS
ncbi:hypothetical protein FH972_018480 [Carpinus fangiana]|uniref:Uncharacterized protein n=1 Tax=Carpinus fangiana TaxID=176857 RepID=A0A5N6RPA0_9ROSI|nr:hypothetical protein FH972_018480 [Carpinus fangiana]